MKKVIRVALLTVAALCFASEAYSQGTLAPLYVFINGSGSISPFQSAQLLEVGKNYEMTAIPDSGFIFSSWQPASIFLLISVEFDHGTSPPTTNIVTSVNISPIPDYHEEATINFTLQPEKVLYDDSFGNLLTVYSGWQVNFVPVPEPSSGQIIFWGLTTIAFSGCRRFREDDRATKHWETR